MKEAVANGLYEWCCEHFVAITTISVPYIEADRWGTPYDDHRQFELLDTSKKGRDAMVIAVTRCYDDYITISVPRARTSHKFELVHPTSMVEYQQCVYQAVIDFHKYLATNAVKATKERIAKTIKRLEKQRDSKTHL